MRAKWILAVGLALVTLSALGAVGSVPLDPGGIEVQGRLSARGGLRLTCLIVPPAPSQAAIHAVRLTSLPSGTPLLTLIAADAPAAVAEPAFECPGTVVQVPLNQDAVSAQASGPPAGDVRIRVEYITLKESGEVTTQVVGEAEFDSLETFHFSIEPAFGERMLASACGFCGDNRCGCSSCSEVFVCCPNCSLRCEPTKC